MASTATVIACVMVCCTFRFSQAAFTLPVYKALVHNATRPGSVIQQVVAIPSDNKAQITYSVTTNDYIDVNTSSGEIVWKASKSPHPDSQNYTVTAMEGGTDVSTAIVTVAVTEVVCPCFNSDTAALKVSVPEGLPGSAITLLYLSDKGCADIDYTLKGDELFTVQEGRLLIGQLDYENRSSAHTQLSCGGRAVDISVTVINMADQPPYIKMNRKYYSVYQHNYTVDSDQIEPILGSKGMRLVARFDSLGSQANRKVFKLNDPWNQLIIGRVFCTNKVCMIPVKSADKVLITSSTDIDIVVVDENIANWTSSDGTRVCNNVTFRFSLTLRNVDELKALQLKPEYKLDVFRSSPLYTPIMTILQNRSNSLTFQLAPVADNLKSCDGILNVSSRQGIVYISNTESLVQCTGETVSYNLSVSESDMTKLSTLVLTLLKDDGNITNVTDGASCADYTNEEECRAHGGLGALQCLWTSVANADSNYTTCVPSTDCTDRQCSGPETLNPYICPQDCLPGNTWSHHSRVLCGHGGSLGLCKAFGVCFCEFHDGSRNCRCSPESLIGVDEYDSSSEVTVGTNQTITGKTVFTPELEEDCGIQCMVIVATVLAITVIAITVIIIWWRTRNTKRVTKVAGNINDWRVNANHLDLNFTSCPDYEGSTPSTVISFFTDWPEAHPYHNTGHMELYDEKWELSRENLIIGDYIGEGEFGRVMKAQYRKCLLDDWSEAAVKMLKDGASRAEYTDLLSEYTLLKEVDHPNIIKLIGAATLNGPFHLVVEYCEHGSLKNYLRSVRSLEPVYVNGTLQFYAEYADQLMAFSWQISKGMQYLSEIKLVHRDLATRNILIAADKVIKISDFGMTKDIYEEDAYKKKGQGRIPVKWMAPESLYHQIYTTKSDVWSFGIALWEIATLGATPYPGIPAERMYNLLQEGYRMDRPETCSVSLYTLMMKCWDYDPATRPSFKELTYSLEKMLKEEQSNHLDLSVAAQSRRLCHGSSSISTGSEEDSDIQQLTVALLPSTDTKFVEDYLVSINNHGSYAERHPLRYTTLDFADED